MVSVDEYNSIAASEISDAFKGFKRNAEIQGRKMNTPVIRWELKLQNFLLCKSCGAVWRFGQSKLLKQEKS